MKNIDPKLVENPEQQLNKLSVFDALRRVVVEASDEYARTYARAGMRLQGEALRVQILYVLSNLDSWKGPRAREAKTVLKAASRATS